MKKFKYTINGIGYRVEVNSIEDNEVELSVNGTVYKVKLDKEAPSVPTPKVKSPIVPKAPAAPQQAAAPKPAAAPAASGAGTPIVSPLPGVILDITCKVGDAVTRGQKLMVLEAMKMENDIKADRDGKVASISVNKGDNIQEGVTLLTIE